MIERDGMGRGEETSDKHKKLDSKTSKEHVLQILAVKIYTARGSWLVMRVKSLSREISQHANSNSYCMHIINRCSLDTTCVTIRMDLGPLITDN